MKEVYSVSIDRAGLADLPELVRCETPEITGAIVAALLSARDPSILAVKVMVQRLAM